MSYRKIAQRMICFGDKYDPDTVYSSMSFTRCNPPAKHRGTDVTVQFK